MLLPTDIGTHNPRSIPLASAASHTYTNTALQSTVNGVNPSTCIFLTNNKKTVHALNPSDRGLIALRGFTQFYTLPKRDAALVLVHSRPAQAQTKGKGGLISLSCPLGWVRAVAAPGRV